MTRTPAQIAMWDQAKASMNTSAKAFKMVWQKSSTEYKDQDEALREAIITISAEIYEALEDDFPSEKTHMIITNLVAVNMLLISREK